MRHSRRAVMSEHYKLYMRKNIFNGRYMVRNLQIALCVFAVLVLVIVTGFLVCTDKSQKKDQVVVHEDTKVKQALFVNSEEKNAKKTEDKVEKKPVSEEVVITSEEIKAENIKETVTESMKAKAIEKKTKEEKTVEKKKKTEFDDRCIANVDETLNIRKEPSTEAEFVGSMGPGAIATVQGNEGEWTKIKSGEVEGYVLSQYILTGESAEEFAKDYVTLFGTILEDGVNIREEKSTESNIVTLLNKEDTLTVLEAPEFILNQENESSSLEDGTDNISTYNNIGNQEITESIDRVFEAEENETEQNEIVWLTVMLEDGQIGYVSSELVSIEKLYTIAVSAEELQRRAAEEVAEKEAERIASIQTQNTATTTADANNNYQGNKTEPIKATESGKCLGTFTVTAYCGCNKCSKGNTRTASGTIPTEGRTIAADTSILPFGTKVVINGIVYTVEDRGSGVRGNHIDIFFSTHEKALAFGRRTIKVYKY